MVSPQLLTHQPPPPRRSRLRTDRHQKLVALLVLLASIGGCVSRLGRLEPLPAEVLRSTPARLARGAYLVEHVTVCLDCHSQRDWDTYSAPIVIGTEGRAAARYLTVGTACPAWSMAPTSRRPASQSGPTTNY